MKIRNIVWPEDRLEHIARHGVSPNEVEEVCYGAPLVFRQKSEGQNPVYVVMGQTDAGRYLLCVLIHFPDENAYPITGRSMTEKEKRRFRKWKNR